jgi:RHS repeat-associated protein
MSSVSGSNSETCTGFPFAAGLSCTGTNWTFNGFTDDVHDTESNLEHVWFRQLSGTQGRWTSPDPYLGSIDISNPQSLNRYGYVLNDPAGSVDPSGLVVNVPTAVIGSLDGSTVLYEHFIDDGPELSFPRNFGGGGAGFGDILGGILGALNGGGSISGNCFLPGACPNLSVPSILDFLPKLPAWGCDPGPCTFASIPILTPAPSPSAKVGQGILDLANFLITTAAAAIHSAFWHRDPPLRINGTHYCGPGGAGDPINAADRACAAHDQCYIDNGLTPTDNFRQLSPDKAAAMQACNQALCNAERATNSSTGRIIDDYFSSTGNYRCK